MRAPGKGGRAAGTAGPNPLPTEVWALLESVGGIARARLEADAATIVVRHGDGERVLICTSAGARDAGSSVSLGSVSDGFSSLSSGAGLLQGAEMASLVGFTPSRCLGAPFRSRRGDVSGGLAVWSHGEPGWGPEQETLLRDLAALCLRQIEHAREVALCNLGEALLSELPDLVVAVGTEGAVLYSSPASEHLLGWSPADLLGRPLEELVHPADWDRLELFAADEGSAVTEGVDVRLARADGGWSSFEGRARRADDGGERRRRVIAFRETGARRRAEEALRRSESRYRRLFEECRDAIYVTDLDGTFVEANPATRDLFGFTGSLAGCSIEDCYADGRDWGELLQQIAGGEQVVEAEVRLRHPEGRSLTGLVTSSPWVDERGTVVGQQSVVRDITLRKEIEERLRLAALHDPLTGLPNRTLFSERLELALTRARCRPDSGFAVVYLDLERFKRINDSLGHARGDQLLVATAQRLTSSLRAGDIVARLGGDEFAVLLEDIANQHSARKLLQRIVDVLSPPFDLSGHEVFVRASIGVAHGSANYGDPQEVLRDADAAMYLSRKNPAEAYQVFDEDMRQEWAQQLQTETDLRRAVEREQLRLHYQPLVELASGRITGFEALLRWEHPQRGLLLPADFLTVAEESGLIVPIGEWVIREACRQIGKWQRVIPARPLTVSVNVSGRQIRPGFVKWLRTVLDAMALDAGALCFEITESILMEDTPVAARVFEELADLGIRMEIDDFGTGYSSLGYLHRFPVRAVKIDRSFVGRMTGRPAHPEIVSSIIGLAHNLGIGATAEGIETIEQLQELRRLGCELGQGFYFAPGLAPEEATALLTSAPCW